MISCERDLQAVYTQHGHLSEEFAEHIKSFMLYIQKRYVGYTDPDLLHEQYVRVLAAVGEYYDVNKGKLSTFLFTVARNTCSQFVRKQIRHSHEVSGDFNGDYALLDHSAYVREELRLPEDSFLVIHDTLVHSTPEDVDTDEIIQRWSLWKGVSGGLYGNK